MAIILVLCQRKHETGGSEFEEWKDTRILHQGIT